MKRMLKRTTCCLVAATGTALSVPSHAMIPVWDVPNFIVNVGQKIMLMRISHQLEDKGEGTINYNTTWIDKSTRNIDNSTHNIDVTTDNSYRLDITNTNIDASFTWIINNDAGGGEIIPIPRKLKDKLAEVMKSQSVDQYTSHYKEYSEYASNPFGRYGDDAVVESARARRAANTALVEAVVSQEAELDSDARALKTLQEKAAKAEGRNAQLQIGNAIAASEVNQLAKMRSMMVVAEAQRVAEAQARADKEARAVAVGSSMRHGLDDAIRHTVAPAPVY
ncbi:P-type conjugative transfer protein TrbJ [Luteibacter sp. 329MFSha]|nr:P-type conjugative transfer protein TrbJ [Luteibacter sp. 329MFSha]